jgi:glycine/D-amino acid oxidase-like deaminating enzyme
MGATGKGEGNVLRGDATGGREAWLALAERFPRAVKLREKGSLTLFEGDGAVELAAQLSGDAEVVDDPRTLEPALRPGLAPAVFVPSDCQVDPRATVLAMLDGLPFRGNAPVLHYDDGGVELATGERITADAVVLCTGAWAADLDVRPRKGQLVALGPAPGLVRRKLIDAAYPAAVASVIEEAVTGEVYVGSSRQDDFIDESVDDDLTRTLIDRAVSWVPALAELPVRRAWTGLRPYRPGGPFVGQLPSGVWACAGHEGAGVGLGPVDGRRLAEMILEAT